MSAHLSIEEIAHSQKQLKRKKIKLLAFTLPLLCFVTLAFLAPIATMLYRSVYHPTVSQLIPQTLLEMEQWKVNFEFAIQYAICPQMYKGVTGRDMPIHANIISLL